MKDTLEEFSKRHPVGSPAVYLEFGDRPMRVQIGSPPFLFHGQPVVLFRALSGTFPISKVKPVAELCE